MEVIFLTMCFCYVLLCLYPVLTALVLKVLNFLFYCIVIIPSFYLYSYIGLCDFEKFSVQCKIYR